MSGRKKHRTANQYLQYLKGELSNQERNSFERDLEGDPFNREALEGLETLTPAQAEEDILSLHTRLRKRLRRRRRIAWYSAAASIASLLIIGTVFLQIYDFNPEVAEETLNEEVYTPAHSESSESSVPEDKIVDETREVQILEALEEEAVVSEAQVTEDPVSVTPVSKAAVRETQITEAPISEVTIEEDIAEDPEPEMITYVEAEATLQDKDTQFDYIVSETKAVPMEEEIIKEDAGGRAKRRNEGLNQPTASREVSGTVVSGEDLKPLPGAAVAMKGSSKGVVTEADGSFTLPMQDDSSATVVASFVGMETQEYNFEEGEDLQLVMQPDAMMLNEVVVLEPQAAPQDNIRSAQPLVGFPAFKDYIKENIQFTEVETTTDRVVVILRFTVTSAGEITDIVPLRSKGEPFTQEAIRLIKEGPSWNPATDENGHIEEIVRIRIVFKK